MGQPSQRLRSNPVFSRADPRLLERLLRAATVKQFAAGERILTEGDPADRIFVLETGGVRVFHASAAGLEVVLKIFRAPAIFGEAEALSKLTFFENVDALEPSSVVALPRDAVIAFLKEDPRCALAFLLDVALRLAISIQNEKSLAFDPVTVRLANYLVSYAAWTNPPDAQEPFVTLTQDDMAAAIGVTRRSVAEDVIAWQKAGILERRGRHYVVRKLAALRRYADPTHLGLTYRLADHLELA